MNNSGDEGVVVFAIATGGRRTSGETKEKKLSFLKYVLCIKVESTAGKGRIKKNTVDDCIL
jgi:hypothetical protein